MHTMRSLGPTPSTTHRAPLVTDVVLYTSEGYTPVDGFRPISKPAIVVSAADGSLRADLVVLPNWGDIEHHHDVPFSAEPKNAHWSWQIAFRQCIELEPGNRSDEAAGWPADEPPLPRDTPRTPHIDPDRDPSVAEQLPPRRGPAPKALPMSFAPAFGDALARLIASQHSS
jgi:hypothetical protein